MGSGSGRAREGAGKRGRRHHDDYRYHKLWVRSRTAVASCLWISERCWSIDFTSGSIVQVYSGSGVGFLHDGVCVFFFFLTMFGSRVVDDEEGDDDYHDEEVDLYDKGCRDRCMCAA